MRRTKIVCTLGPASADAETMEKMLLAGMNVARLNFSHNTHEGHKKTIDTFRAVRDRLGLAAAVMLDTRGPEIRLGAFKNGAVALKAGDAFTLTGSETVGDENHVSVSFQGLAGQLKPCDRILIDDGKIALVVERTTETDVICTVETGGELSDHKSINIPYIALDMPYMSEQDKADVLFGIEQDVDFIAASFVRREDDIAQLRKFIDYNGGHRIKIIAKIENLEGVDNFDAILQHADGIMVARGDMGVEIDYERLPGIQKRFIRRCYSAGKMVITATQMLESMIQNPSPTRAEITDVANAVFDGTSAIMLSGESAMGRYPVRAVEVMARIAEQAELDAFATGVYTSLTHDINLNDITEAICDATRVTARDIEAKAIIAVTKYGHTARMMSKFRPPQPIVAATPEPKTFHQLSLSWGVYPALSRSQKTTDDLFLHAVDCAKQLGLAVDGDRVVITGGVPLDTSGTTNLLKVEIVGKTY